MGHADIGQYGNIWLRYGSETVHFTKVRDAHFQYGCLMGFLQLKDRKRKPDFIIEVAFGLMYLVFSGQHRGNHLFCTRLAYASADAYDFYVQAA